MTLSHAALTPTPESESVEFWRLRLRLRLRAELSTPTPTPTPQSWSCVLKRLGTCKQPNLGCLQVSFKLLFMAYKITCYCNL